MSDKEKEQEITPEKIEELTNQIANLTKERDNVVGELKEDREKRQEMQTQIEELQEALTSATQANNQKPEDKDTATLIEQLLEQKLGERDASVAKGNKQAAIERFVNENKEFHDENDTTGKRKEALVNAIARFNTSNLKTVDEFYSVVKDAARLLGSNTEPSNPSESKPEVPSGPGASSQPKVVDVSGLSDGEAKLIEKNGWTKEKYLSLKQKNPAYMANLVNIASQNY